MFRQKIQLKRNVAGVVVFLGMVAAALAAPDPVKSQASRGLVPFDQELAAYDTAPLSDAVT
jgi:hypothetical protein